MNPYRCALMSIGLVALLVTNISFAARSDRLDGFRLTTIDGSIVKSSSITINQAGEVSGLTDRNLLQIGDVILIERLGAADSTPIADAGAANLIFAASGTVSVCAPKLTDGLLTFDSINSFKAVPVEAVRAIVWEPSNVVTQLVNNPPKDSDALIVRQGDQLRGVEGIIEAITEQYVRLRFKGKSRKIGLEKVAGIVMADLQLPSPEDKVPVTITLIDGGTIDGHLDRWVDQQITLAIGGVAVSVSVNSLARMSVKNERLVYLSDLEPVTVQQRAVFTVDRPWQRDRSVGGNRLTLFDSETRKNVTFDKGIGTHSWSSFVFANDRGLDRFMATVGIDVETGGRGACRMIVRGDGIELWAGKVTGSSGPQSIDVNINGIQSVELEVVPDEDFDLADHANWCEARFVKTK